MKNRSASIAAVARSATRCTAFAATLGLLLGGQNAAKGGYDIFINPVDSSISGLNADWASYILGVSSDDGSQIAAVDVDLKGTFRQEWRWDYDTGSYVPTPASHYYHYSGDSHLLVADNALTVVSASEDRDASGVGTQMKGVWGIPGGNAISLDLAYMVIPRGSESQLEYAIDVGNPSGEVINFRQGASFPMPSPQPLSPPLPAPVSPPVTTQPPYVPPTAPLGIPIIQALATQILWSADNGLPAGFTAYQLNVSTLDSSLIGAVDVRINAPLHQEWLDLDGDGVVDPTPRGLTTSGSDSHLLIPNNGLAMPLAEDNDAAVDPLGNGTSSIGVGSHLGGAWATPGAAQSDSAQLAYIVVPDDLNLQDLDISVDLVARQGDSFSPVINLAANNFAVLGADGAVISSPQPIELPPTTVPPVVDPPQGPIVINEPPLAGDPPPSVDLPPVVELPTGIGEEPIVGVIDDVVPPDRVGDPWIDTEEDGPTTGEPIVVPPMYLPHLVLRNIDYVLSGENLLFTENEIVGALFRDALVNISSAPAKVSGSQFVEFFNTDAALNTWALAYDLSGQGGIASQAPEPTAIVLAILAAVGALGVARHRKPS